jgi:hypothetical protein
LVGSRGKVCGGGDASPTRRGGRHGAVKRRPPLAAGKQKILDPPRPHAAPVLAPYTMAAAMLVRGDGGPDRARKVRPLGRCPPHREALRMNAGRMPVHLGARMIDSLVAHAKGRSRCTSMAADRPKLGRYDNFTLGCDGGLVRSGRGPSNECRCKPTAVPSLR